MSMAICSQHTDAMHQWDVRGRGRVFGSEVRCVCVCVWGGFVISQPVDSSMQLDDISIF